MRSRIIASKPSLLHPVTGAAVLFVICLTVSSAAAEPGLVARPSHLGAHLGSPPDELLQCLAVPDTPIHKGYMPLQETCIIQALKQAGLRQRILKVAVAEAVGVRMGLIKLQASDTASGCFRVSDLEADAVAALSAAFDVMPELEHLDLWSVVPGDMASYGQIHQPVFSVAAARADFERLSSTDLPARQLLGKLGAVRYAPLFLSNAADDPMRLACLDNPFPRTAYRAPNAADNWARFAGLAQEGNTETEEPSCVRVLRRGRTDQRNVAITIDDGPHPLIIPLMLAVLDHYDVKATFFVVGHKAEQYPGLVREIAQAGHELGNHTYWHRRMSELPLEEARAELRSCSAVVGALTGQQMYFIRPPGGDYSEASLQAIAESGLTVALWTHNTGDWRKVSPRQIADRALAGIEPGAIILMHDGDLSSVRALKLIIEGLLERNLQPVCLSEIAGNGAAREMSVQAMMNYLDSGWQPAELR